MQFKEYIPKESLKNICLLDTMGLEDSIGGMNIKDIEKLVAGHILQDYKVRKNDSLTCIV